MEAAGGEEERDPGIQKGGFQSSVHCCMLKEMQLKYTVLTIAVRMDDGNCGVST